jgi:hypothetical protein
MQPQQSPSLALEYLVAAYRARMEAAIAGLPRGPEREGLRREFTRIDAAHVVHEWPKSER